MKGISSKVYVPLPAHPIPTTMLAQKRLTFIGFMILTWLLAIYFFVFIRNFGLGEFGRIQVTDNLNLRTSFLHFTFLGVVIGLFYSWSELLFDKFGLNRKSYGVILAIKLLSYVVLTKTILFIFVSVLIKTGEVPLGWSDIFMVMTSKNYLVFLAYFTVVATFISFFRQINQKFGPGVLWEMLKGTYHKPQEKERIFMFIDLRSSTTIAEKLGHILYSHLIQDCFYDLTEVVLRHQARIYQYVGDEVILVWDLENGLQDHHCIQAFFDYQKILQENSARYLKKYGLVPEFKAGLHWGKVTVAEVGVIKKEIAFHGDVLNTTARIQGKCNEYRQELLISQAMKNKLGALPNYKSLPLGEELLKGKTETVQIFGLREL